MKNNGMSFAAEPSSAKNKVCKEDKLSMPVCEGSLVSIAMCTYNGERFVKEQLDSLIAQDYPNLEIIIIDDRSTDSTFDILKEYEVAHSHICVIRNEENLGFVRNFEKAISLCSGEYVSLCDQDDIWLPHKITTLVNNIGDAGLIYSAVQMIDENGAYIDKIYPPSNRLDGNCHMGLLFRNCAVGHTCLMKRSIVNEALPFPAKIYTHDHWIAFVAAATSGIIAYPEILSLYRDHENNVLLRNKQRRGSENKSRRMIRTFHERIKFIKAIGELECLLTTDRNLIQRVRKAYGKFPRCYFNKKLQKILIDHREQLLPIYQDEKKAIQRLCQGLWRFRLKQIEKKTKNYIRGSKNTK